GDLHELEVLGWATVFGKARPDVVAYLLAHGATHNISSAVATGNIAEIGNVAAARRDDLDKPMDSTNHHRRPLHLAIVKKQHESLATLLELGANMEATDDAGLTPLDQAALAGETAMAELLLEHGAVLRLPAAIALNRDVDRLLRDNTGELRPGGRWGTLIVHVAERGTRGQIETLIAHGASVNVHDDPSTAVDGAAGYTALHAAAFHGNREAAAVLLAHGAGVTQRDSKYHGTPAGWADFAKHSDVRDLILQGPIDMFDAISFDRVDRLRGIFDRHVSFDQPMGSLLEREPEPDAWTKSWWTPLAFAIVLGKIDAVRELIALGARTTVRDPDNRTMREFAADLGHNDIAQLLDAAAAAAEPPTGTDRASLVARFLTNACPDHHVRGGWSHIVARKTAMRLLEQHPEIAHDSIYTAVVCGDVDDVRRILAEHPDAARTKGGPKGSFGGASQRFIVEPTVAAQPRWEPLLYLCFARLDTPQASDNAAAIAELLLDHGADPNSYFMAGDSRYSPLTGVIGQGEEARPPHTQREALTRLLLDRGANPYDVQVFYNLHFHPGTLWYLKLAYEYSVKHDRKADWDDPTWSMLDMGGFGLGAYYLLSVAIRTDGVELAEWVLSHGADSNPPIPTRSKQRQSEIHEQPMSAAIADLLVRHGGMPPSRVPPDENQFVDAAMRLDRPEAERLLALHPEFLRSPKAMFAAAARDRDDVVRLLLDLGTPLEVESAQRERTLHIAAYNDAPRVAQLLIDRGAEIDPVETAWSNTPIDAAIWGQQSRIIDLLGPHTNDVWNLTFLGLVARLRDVLAKHPERAKASYEGMTLLMRLPGETENALDVANLLVAYGADPTARNRDGLSPADLAAKRGLDTVAKFLRGQKMPDDG
ncbi:MAG TPA: ankyrin repeat domain-containing protein, partial [Gemmatimonadaceae bacterium]|nr:ankyrin repeat domain-containing protein [Gemmatimonadaceae bacterium]